MKPTGYLCMAPVYRYNGWHFEYGYNVWPLKKDGELRSRCGHKFLTDISGFFKLSEVDRRQYRIGGGCIKF